MFAKIITPVITILVSIAVAVVLFFMLMLGLNGFHGTDGGRGLFAFAAWGVFTALLLGLLSLLSVNFLINRKQKSAMFAALVVVPVFAVVGVAMNFVCLIIGIAVAEISRSSF